jgi:mono/diheme cytochrome c family protein
MKTIMATPVRSRLLALGGLLLLVTSRAFPGEAKKPPAPSPAAVQFFEAKIRPLLAEHCFKCHGAAKQKGDLRLDSRSAVLEGGDQGPAIVPGSPEKSLLIKAIRHDDANLKMPPSRKLGRQQIADLTQWVKMGAPWPGANNDGPKTTRRGEFQISARDRAHWAFQPLKRPPVPPVKQADWAANPIDAFILARLEAKGMRPNPPAERRQLIRRVYYDLTGLPPTPAEVEAFVADQSPRAYAALVERLLASPHYGEKWGRHWLDLVRFAETNSYERDNPKPHAWRYRDYIIQAFNRDKPYDQFIREQLAGDELVGNPAPGKNSAGTRSSILDPRSSEMLVATGYYRLGIWDDEPTDRLQALYDGLDDIIATTGQVFLGLTVDCARCHDHKIDPISQKDYYRLLAFFHNINHYRNGGPTDVRPIGPGTSDRSGLLRRSRDLALCVTEAGSQAPETFVLLRGNPHVPGPKVEPAFPQILSASAPVISAPPQDARTTGRRRVLADWIASKDNRLTARVMVNRLWQQHFGRGIVRSPNNFGLQGDKPTHPELLDWLAAELIRQDWRLKPLHRLILNSSAYRMSSRGNRTALAADPANDLFWRFDMRRLGAEEIRDSILAVSGTLNPKMYGPGVYPTIPDEVLAGQSMPGKGWGKSSPAEQNRRSVYVHVKRSLLTPILEGFDVAETDRSAPVRFTTTQPTQALLLLNSDFLHQQAAVFAGRLRREAGDDVAKQVRRALFLATGRPPADKEVRRGLNLIKSLQEKDGATVDVSVQYFYLMVLNLNEFVYLD